ncbi:retinoic acid receptor alpha-A isoform X1 [Silurus asotus]|uniref:Retinoic acid receptor alpha-A isoform X1 n=1 Tax=Silurus asotus TaxID=30991 RepID=A0AAD5FL56_SILAS|nr:retinoic acid receptor alpha-A isoform X1 [Silurus asotus]
MSGKGFPVAHFSYFLPHVIGGLSPPSIPTMTVSGYSTPSPAITKNLKRSDKPGSYEDRPRKGKPGATSAAEDKFLRIH